MSITYRQLAEGLCYGMDRCMVVDVTELHQAYVEEANKNRLVEDEALLVLFQVGLEILCVAKDIASDNSGAVHHNIPDSFLFTEFRRFEFKPRLTGDGYDYRDINPLNELLKVLPISKLYPYILSKDNLVLIRDWITKDSKIYVEVQVVDV